jgi:hypothetical protein
MVVERDRHIFFLPNEILVVIFSDVLSLRKSFCENYKSLSLVCKMFNLLTKSNAIWKNICDEIYKPYNFKIELKKDETFYKYCHHLYMVYNTITYLKLNYHINKKIKYYRITFKPSLDIINNTFYIVYGDKQTLVKKKEQNDKLFNILLCKILYKENSICMYCLENNPDIDNENDLPTITRLRVINEDSPLVFGGFIHDLSTPRTPPNPN